MGIKEFIKKIKTRMNKDIRNNYITYKIPKNYYKDLIKENEIENIINNMPNGLSNMEKAYNIYIELGKKISESPRYIFSNLAKKEAIYFDKIDKEYFGICKSISELYVSILKDKRIRIPAYLVKQHLESEISHIDTVIKIDGKYFLLFAPASSSYAYISSTICSGVICFTPACALTFFSSGARQRQCAFSPKERISVTIACLAASDNSLDFT